MARFANVSSEELNSIVKKKDAIATKKQIDVSFKVLTVYCEEKGITFCPEQISKSAMNDVLKKFYVEARKTDGEMYRKSSFNSLRFGIQRKMQSLRVDFDIVNDGDFQLSNEVFKAQCVEMKRLGLNKVDHHPPIPHEHITKLYNSGVFDVNNPIGLQRKVFFELMLYFCRRGGENLRNLVVTDFAVRKTPDGQEYVEKVTDEMSKNHRECDSNHDGSIMVSTGIPRCPVKSFKKYVASLNPKQTALFQRPKMSVPQQGPWYDNMVLGVKQLGKMMKNISIAAELPVTYTNHCIRATTVTILDSVGMEARHIMTVSGHRSEASIRSYSRTSIDLKRKMSSTISSASGCARKLSKLDAENYPKTFNFGVDLYNSPEKDDHTYNENMSSVESSTSSLNISSDLDPSCIVKAARKVNFHECTFNLNNGR